MEECLLFCLSVKGSKVDKNGGYGSSNNKVTMIYLTRDSERSYKRALLEL